MGAEARGVFEGIGGNIARTSIRPIVTLIDGAAGELLECCAGMSGLSESDRGETERTSLARISLGGASRSDPLISMIFPARGSRGGFLVGS